MKNNIVSVEKLPLKSFLLALTASAFLVACSTPKYTYYFNKYALQNNVSAGKGDVKCADSIFVNRMSKESFSLPVQKETFLASASKEKAVLINTDLMEVTKRTDTAFSTFTVSRKKSIRNKLPVFNKAQVIKDVEARKGDKKKNGIAIAGFILSIAGLTLFFLGPFMLVLCAFGTLFSLIGIKSEKRKLAIAGLIIGIVGFGVVYLYALISGLGYST